MSLKSRMIERVVHTSQLLSSTMDFDKIIAIVTEQTLDNSGADVAGLYLSGENECKLVYSRGREDIPETFSKKTELVDFLIDCKQLLFITNIRDVYFPEIFINEHMKSAAALPLVGESEFFGFILLNSRHDNLFDNEKLQFLEGVSKMASGLMMNSRIHTEMKRYLLQIESLEKYQQNIFRSMSNLLITLDMDGNIRYFNESAEKKLHLTEKELNHSYKDFFQGKMAKNTLIRLERARKANRTLLGVEGIFSGEKGEIDYSLNFTPMESKLPENQGAILIITDQTAEREMEKEVSQAKEDRRMIKDVFSRYLSSDIVQSLTQSPDAVKLGGDKKKATIFFADICGYTAFSEGKEPGFILKVLNEFFNDAVDIILQKKGYIDKFIGDCIMAAWGVPMETEQSDAISAVDCALALQELVASSERTFFRDEAKNLKIAIGMHTGPLVAGNIGGVSRMDYSVIGDTVNVAARLEGVATAGEIIITEQTKELVENYFLLEKRDAVKLKGKAKPLQIYNVYGRK